MSKISWENLIEIDRKWVERQLNYHFDERNGKINIRVYTIKASGTTINSTAVCEELLLMLPDYVYSAEQKRKLGVAKAAAWSPRYFGHRDTNTDGKFGELLLFALVESILGCKMVAHKLVHSTNFNDQIKGGDGIFLGNYEIEPGKFEPAYLIGESKVTQNRSKAIEEGLESINRFHDVTSSPQFNSTELIVARQNLHFKEDIDLDELYDRLTPTSDFFKAQILVHPILLMFDTDKITSAEKEAKNHKDLEDRIVEFINTDKADYKRIINEKLKIHENAEKVYLDFFILPFNDIASFRNTMYYCIHGTEYRE